MKFIRIVNRGTEEPYMVNADKILLIRTAHTAAGQFTRIVFDVPVGGDLEYMDTTATPESIIEKCR